MVPIEPEFLVNARHFFIWGEFVILTQTGNGLRNRYYWVFIVVTVQCLLDNH